MKLICKEACAPKESVLKGNWWSLVNAILVLFMPKCAFCWAAYMGFFSSVGLISIPYRPWFFPVSIILFILTLVKLLYSSIRKRNFLAFALGLSSGMIILLQRLWQPGWDFDKVAIAMMAIAVLFDPWLKFRDQWVMRSKS